MDVTEFSVYYDLETNKVKYLFYMIDNICYPAADWRSLTTLTR